MDECVLEKEEQWRMNRQQVGFWMQRNSFKPNKRLWKRERDWKNPESESKEIAFSKSNKRLMWEREQIMDREEEVIRIIIARERVEAI